MNFGGGHPITFYHFGEEEKTFLDSQKVILNPQDHFTLGFHSYQLKFVAGLDGQIETMKKD